PPRAPRVFFSAAPPASPSTTLSLHDALPICQNAPSAKSTSHEPSSLSENGTVVGTNPSLDILTKKPKTKMKTINWTKISATTIRSEEHTSELQSRFDLVCRLLLEKKNVYRLQ